MSTVQTSTSQYEVGLLHYSDAFVASSSPSSSESPQPSIEQVTKLLSFHSQPDFMTKQIKGLKSFTIRSPGSIHIHSHCRLPATPCRPLRSNSETPVLTDASGATHTSNREKAETFGQHFSSKCSLGDQDFLNGVFPEVRRRTDQHIHTVHFRVAAVKAALRKLVPSKATGQDGIPARVLKECASELALPLSKLFTLSFVTGACPAAWKIAMVVPVHKKKARSDPRNYRPVSLLPVMSKVMESLINRSLTNFLERQKVLSQHQFGFRRGLGTSDLLTKLHSEWSKAAGLGGSVYVLAVDIAGAFDRVSHAGVLHQAACCGVTGDLLTWLKSYLRDRQLKAVVSGQESPLYPVQAGVPQGSILGPTLFLLYVNSCEDVVPDGVKLAVYADDTTLYQVLRTEATILQSRSLLQAAVDAVVAWGAAWKIRFEPSKSQAHHRPSPAGMDCASNLLWWHTR